MPTVLANVLFGVFLIMVAVRTVWPDVRAWRSRRAPHAD
jgi:hypothetical protein